MTAAWPPLPYPGWEATCDTLHLWTQIAGKTLLALTPMENHWWNVSFAVTPRGLSTRTIPYKDGAFEIEFDFTAHQLAVRTSWEGERTLPLRPQTVADFYAEYLACLAGLGIQVRINPTPQEFYDPTPFDQDRHHATYEREPVENFHRILLGADRLFHEFRARYLGKCSPVQFFWGSFDLAVSRFSGREAPPPPGADAVTREAYSREVISCGFWPGDRRYPQAFYSYTLPAPPTLDRATVQPFAAAWNPALGEFFFDYDAMRAAPDPAAALLEFCQSSYEAGANLAAWDRPRLERAA